jgi:hypothetical protein
MAPSTRNTQRDPPAVARDTEMNENPSQLCLPPTQPTVTEITAAHNALQPATHLEPTRQALTDPNFDLAAYIEAIPSTVVIENVQFSVQNTATFTDSHLLAEIQANAGATDAKFNQLLQLVSTQFTAGNNMIEAF